MGNYTQDNRPISVKFDSLEKDDLLLEGFSGSEWMSKLFTFQLSLLAEVATARAKKIAFDKIVGLGVTIKVQLSDDQTFRYFNGIVSRFSQGELVHSAKGTAEFIRYRAEVVPQFWTLTRTVQSRIFQHMNVPDILKKVLTGLKTDTTGITGTFEPRDYCVQYRESDFQFASRLMEEEGIFYFFKHTESGHTMYLANSSSAYTDALSGKKAIFQQAFGGYTSESRVYSWEKVQELRSGKVTLWDYTFEMPDKHLEATKTTLETVKAGTAIHKLKLNGNDAMEIYDYPGRYANRFDGVNKSGGDQAADLQKIFTDNTRTTGIRMQQETLPALAINGHSTYRELSAGLKFTLDKHFNGNGDYTLTRVEHRVVLENAYVTNQDATLEYTNGFDCIPFALPFSPPMVTPKARVEGTQTAVVVGNQGQEIFTDKYGRVKVQFHWDRDGKNDADSSCWVRVATLWAGKNWGVYHIPRIGHEVIVDFIEGDPDQPIIVGSVYNYDNMPPYKLPDNQTRSGIKTRSSLQGTDQNFNELRFEDKKGSEEVYFHAEKDFNRVVENNDTLAVGSSNTATCADGSQTISIYNNRTETVEKGNETVTIKEGNRTITVSKGNDKHEVSTGKRDIIVESDDTTTVRTGNRTVNVNTGTETLNVKTGARTVNVDLGDETHNIKTGNRTVNVDTGNDTHNIKLGNRSVTISVGNDTLKLNVGNQSTTLALGASSTEAMQSITLKVGANSIKIDQTGITLEGLIVKIKGTAMLQAQAPLTQVSGDGFLTLKGGVIMIN